MSQPTSDWRRFVGELAWAIELVVMYDRWHDKMGMLVLDDEHVRRAWVKMCMRLGDDSAHRIVSSNAVARIVGA